VKPKEIDLWKPNQTDVLGLTFEVPADLSFKGVVVADIMPGGLIARSKKLRIGDVVHAVNGRPVTTPEQGASLLREAKGVVQIVATRANAKPQLCNTIAGEDSGSAPEVNEEITKSDKSRSFLPSLSMRSTRKKKAAEVEPKEEQSNTTVVVSCSALILESKKIVGEAAGVDEKLDQMYTSLKAREIPSQQALAQLIEVVGQTVVEQAGLVIASAQSGSLPDGWVEYFDTTSNRPYYYNVHSKVTTWIKPRKNKPPPPPPPPAPTCADMAQQAAPPSAHDINSTSKGHDVAGVIASMHTKKKAVETVQLECATTPRHGMQGLVSVTL